MRLRAHGHKMSAFAFKCVEDNVDIGETNMYLGVPFTDKLDLNYGGQSGLRLHRGELLGCR